MKEHQEDEKVDFARSFQIRYIKLHFKIEFLEDTVLPKHKVSTLRGGVGEMLLRANCVRDRKCEICDFKTECLVQRTMYSQFEIKPEFVTTGESVGYVYECTNYREQFRAGDRLEFNLLLLGKTIVYFNQYMQAICALGQQGIGKHHSRFQVVEVKNSRLQPMLSGNTLDMSKYEILTVADYVEHRMKQLEQKERQNRLVFDTPLTLKYQGEFLNQFRTEALFASADRRIYMLDCFEGIENDCNGSVAEPLNILHQECRLQGVERYSGRKGEHMTLRGIIGSVDTEPMSDYQTRLLLAGELLHIGKNTSFGFGHYRVL